MNMEYEEELKNQKELNVKGIKNTLGSRLLHENRYGDRRDNNGYYL
jgi:hypothetical protein